MKKSEELKREKYYANVFSLPPECNPLCLVRSCFNKYENKGSFSVGRGYTSYHDEFYPACGTRMNCGCPSSRDSGNEEFDINKAKELLSHKEVPTRIKEALQMLVGGK